jgi:hypothetical protein
LTLRTISIGTDAAHKDALVAGDQPAIQVPGLKGVTEPLTNMFVPGRENVDGKTEHYLFHRDSQKRVVYRTIATEHDAPQSITLVVDDRPVAQHWEQATAFNRPVATIPVPGRQDADGKTEFYVFQHDDRSQLTYVTIAVKRDNSHADSVVTGARTVADRWKASLSGVSDLVTVIPVPGEQSVGGKSHFYVFHRDTTRRLLYRTISVGEDSFHADAQVTEDRLVADWWKASLTGVQ